jgi:hypothetical protein
MPKEQIKGEKVAYPLTLFVITFCAMHGCFGCCT